MEYFIASVIIGNLVGFAAMLVVSMALFVAGKL